MGLSRRFPGQNDTNPVLPGSPVQWTVGISPLGRDGGGLPLPQDIQWATVPGSGGSHGDIQWATVPGSGGSHGDIQWAAVPGAGAVMVIFSGKPYRGAALTLVSLRGPGQASGRDLPERIGGSINPPVNRVRGRILPR